MKGYTTNYDTDHRGLIEVNYDDVTKHPPHQWFQVAESVFQNHLRHMPPSVLHERETEGISHHDHVVPMTGSMIGYSTQREGELRCYWIKKKFVEEKPCFNWAPVDAIIEELKEKRRILHKLYPLWDKPPKRQLIDMHEIIAYYRQCGIMSHSPSVTQRDINLKRQAQLIEEHIRRGPVILSIEGGLGKNARIAIDGGAPKSIHHNPELDGVRFSDKFSDEPAKYLRSMVDENDRKYIKAMARYIASRCTTGGEGEEDPEEMPKRYSWFADNVPPHSYGPLCKADVERMNNTMKKYE